MPTKSKARISKAGLNKKKGFHFRWWMAAVLVAVIVLVGILVVNFSHAGSSYPNGCWVYSTSKAKYQYESSSSSCSSAEQRGRTIKAATSKPSQAPVLPLSSYPNGCRIYIPSRGTYSFESSPASCQAAASHGKQVIQP